eukprot:5102364-Prymnesium_polylepis.1
MAPGAGYHSRPPLADSRLDEALMKAPQVAADWNRPRVGPFITEHPGTTGDSSRRAQRREPT